MKFSNNINFDQAILKSEKAEVLSHYLNIASLNLDDFNARLNLNIHLRYDENECKFVLADNYSQESIKIVYKINWFNWFSVQPDFEGEFQERYLNSVLAERDDILQSIRFPIYLTKSVNRSDIDFFNSNKDFFINKYKNYHPLGFLSEASSLEITNKLNQYCSDLQTEKMPIL